MIEEVENKEKIFLRALLTAHNAQALLYSKDRRSRALGRKLRPELKCLYIAQDVNKALNLIKKHNSDPDSPGIDVVIADADLSSIRLIDVINKRAEDQSTKKLPLIATILLLNDRVDQEYLNNITSIGGVTAIIPAKTSSRNVFEKVVEIMHRQKMIESAYKDLKHSTSMKKFPFLPLFQSSNGDDDEDEEIYSMSEEEEEGDDDDLHENDENDDNLLGIDGFSTNDSIGKWSYASSMIPAGIKDLRDVVAGNAI
jgi:hypothetical protein